MNKNGLNTNPVILGSSVYLRPPGNNEITFIKKLWEQNGIIGDNNSTNFSNENLENWYKSMVYPGESTDFYCLIFSKSHEPIGEVSIYQYEDKTSTANFNIKTLKNYSNKEYEKDAIELMLHYYFFRWGGKNIIIDFNSSVSVKKDLCKKFGFQLLEKDCNKMKLDVESFKKLHQ